MITTQAAPSLIAKVLQLMQKMERGARPNLRGFRMIFLQLFYGDLRRVTERIELVNFRTDRVATKNFPCESRGFQLALSRSSP